MTIIHLKRYRKMRRCECYLQIHTESFSSENMRSPFLELDYIPTHHTMTTPRQRIKPGHFHAVGTSYAHENFTHTH